MTPNLCFPHSHELLFFEARLDEYTAALLREDGLDVVCAFVNDDLSAPVIDKLKEAVRALCVGGSMDGCINL